MPISMVVTAFKYILIVLFTKEKPAVIFTIRLKY
jgi:hypothetical protein